MARAGRPFRPWRIKCQEILSDGQWHDWDALINEAGLAVPPEVAYRKRILRNAIKARKGGWETTEGTERYQKEMDRQIETGRRFIISQTLHNMLRAGVIERDENRRVRKVG